MAPFEERLSAVEQTVATLRQDFLKAIVDNTHSMGIINKVVTQQEQNLRDADHEITILLGVIGSQGKDIKEMKMSLATLGEHLNTFEQQVHKRFEAQDIKLDQILLMLDRLTPKLE